MIMDKYKDIIERFEHATDFVVVEPQEMLELYKQLQAAESKQLKHHENIIDTLKLITEMEIRYQELRGELEAAYVELDKLKEQKPVGLQVAVQRTTMAVGLPVEECSVMKWATHFITEYAHPVPAQQDNPKNIGFNDFINALKDAGWKDTADAQWDGASKLHEKWFISVQQSPAVAVPNGIDLNFMADCLITYRSSIFHDYGVSGLLKKIEEQIQLLTEAPTPPSAEQKDKWRKTIAIEAGVLNDIEIVLLNTFVYLRDTNNPQKDLINSLIKWHKFISDALSTWETNEPQSERYELIDYKAQRDNLLATMNIIKTSAGSPEIVYGLSKVAIAKCDGAKL